MPGRPPPVNVQANRGFEVSRANLRDATIVFDLDGTLVDTAPDLTKALNDALTRRDLAGDIRSAVGLGARVMIEEALRRAGAAEDIDEMLAEVLVHYEANIAAESRPFPGAVASLEMLAKAGQGSRCARTSANISRASCSRRLAFNITFTALRATTRSPCRSRTRPRHPCDRVCRR
jgi:phosphoglycolate phosphatase